MGHLVPPPKNKEWVGEAVLWTAWHHQGSLKAIKESELICLEPRAFGEVMSLHPRPYFYAQRYADKFIGFINGLPKFYLIDILRDEDFYKEALLIDAYVSISNQDDASSPRSPCRQESFNENDAPLPEACVDKVGQDAPHQMCNGPEPVYPVAPHTTTSCQAQQVQPQALPHFPKWCRPFGLCPSLLCNTGMEQR